MQNLLKLIVKYHCLLMFIALETMALFWFATTEPTARSTMFTASNTVVAGMNTGVSGVTQFFSLTQANRHLAEENARLYAEIDRLKSIAEQSVEADTAYCYAHLAWKYYPAKVVNMTTNTLNNYIVLNKGLRDSIAIGEGVVSHDGVVGVVSAVNSHYSLITPIIHPKIHISCRLKNNGYVGFLQWQGGSCRYANLTDIARHIDVQRGDTVLTSGLTRIFPENIQVGVIDDVQISEGDTYQTLRVRLSTDFNSLRYVQVVVNPVSALQDSLLTGKTK